MQLHYQTLGQGQPLILLHGLFGSGDNWGKVAKHFSQTHQVISVDLRNHGKSPHSDVHTYADMANDVLELCDTLQLDTVHLLGHSMGGKAAMQFATEYPERMDKLIIVDMGMRAYSDKQTPLMDAMMDVNLSAFQSRSKVNQALSSTIPNVQIRQFLLMNLIKNKSGLQWRINLTALKANYPAIRQAVCASSHNEKYEKPCLFIRGERSSYITDDDIVQIHNHFITAKFASLPTAHWVHAEQPQAFIDIVDEFIKK